MGIIAEVGSAFVSILPSAKGFGSKLSKQVEPETKKTGKSLGASLGKAFAIAGGAAAAVGFIKGSIGEAREAQKVGALTAAVIKSTGGAANVSAKQVANLAGAISNKTGIDDEAIQSGQNMLLTFKNIRNEAGKGNDIFNQTSKTLVDMAAALGKDPKTAAIALGKALNDPIKGISALGRVGVQFTEKQKGVIKSLVETGHTAEAQKIILKELNSEFGGAAAAQATAGDKAKVAFENLQETVGTALLPVLDRLANFFTTKIAPAVTKFVTQMQKGTGAGGRLRDKLEQVGAAVKDGAGFLNNHRSAVAAVVAAYVGYRAALVGIAIAQRIASIATSIATAATKAHTVATAVNQSLLFTWLGVKALEAAAWIRATAGAVASTIAMAANRAAYAALSLQAFIVQKGIEAAAWIRATAAAVANKVAILAAAAASRIAAAASKVWAAGQWLLNAALTANPIGLVVAAIALLVVGLVIAYKKSETFRAIVNGAFRAVVAGGKALWGALRGYFRLVVIAWLTVAGAIIKGAAKAFGWIPGIGKKIKGLAAGFDRFKADVNRALGGIHDKTVKVTANTGAASAALAGIQHQVSALDGAHAAVTVGVTRTGAGIGANARGTNDWRGGLSIVGERGPELVNLPKHSQVIPNHRIAAAAGGGDGVMMVQVVNAGDIAAATDVRGARTVAAYSGVTREAVRARR